MSHQSLTKVKPEKIYFNIFRISFFPGKKKKKKIKPESVLDKVEVQNHHHAGSSNTVMGKEVAQVFWLTGFGWGFKLRAISRRDKNKAIAVPRTRLLKVRYLKIKFKTDVYSKNTKKKK